ncbi:polysaccharide pyruvyl transferase family protein [Chloroflexota bacterium]
MNNTSSKKRIVISGWYGHKCLGDEAQLSAIISMIRSVLPDSEITVFSDHPDAVISEHQVNSIYGRKHGLSSLKRLWTLFKADLFILGGGTLFYDVEKGANLMVWLTNVILSKLMGTPVMHFSGGIGLIYSSISKYYMRHIYSTIDMIVLRDELSEKNLRAIGVTNPVHIGVDSTFTLARTIDNGYRKTTGRRKPNVGINVRYWIYNFEDVPHQNQLICEDFGGSSSDFKDFQKSIARTIEYLKQNKDATVTFYPFSFTKVKDKEDDIALAEEIARLVSDRNGVSLITEDLTYKEMLSRMRGIDLLIGMRLHALVFAAMLGIPMIAICYEPKVAALMKQIGQEEYLINTTTALKHNDLCRKIGQLWENRQLVNRQLKSIVPGLSSESEKSVQLMLTLLAEKRARINLVIQGIVLLIKSIPVDLFYTLYRGIRRVLRFIRYMAPLPFLLKVSWLIETLKYRIHKI